MRDPEMGDAYLVTDRIRAAFMPTHLDPDLAEFPVAPAVMSSCRSCCIRFAGIRAQMGPKPEKKRGPNREIGHARERDQLNLC